MPNVWQIKQYFLKPISKLTHKQSVCWHTCRAVSLHFQCSLIYIIVYYTFSIKETLPVWVNPSIYSRSFSLLLFFPLNAASSFLTGKLPALSQSLFRFPGRDPCEHCLCFVFPGNLWWFVTCETILRTFSVRASMSPEMNSNFKLEISGNLVLMNMQIFIDFTYLHWWQKPTRAYLKCWASKVWGRCTSYPLKHPRAVSAHWKLCLLMNKFVKNSKALRMKYKSTTIALILNKSYHTVCTESNNNLRYTFKCEVSGYIF